VDDKRLRADGAQISSLDNSKNIPQFERVEPPPLLKLVAAIPGPRRKGNGRQGPCADTCTANISHLFSPAIPNSSASFPFAMIIT
jgi:hypothetical protein